MYCSVKVSMNWGQNCLSKEDDRKKKRNCCEKMVERNFGSPDMILRYESAVPYRAPSTIRQIHRLIDRYIDRWIDR